MHVLDLCCFDRGRLVITVSLSAHARQVESGCDGLRHQSPVLLDRLSAGLLLSGALLVELGSLQPHSDVVFELLHDVAGSSIALLLALQGELGPVPLEL